MPRVTPYISIARPNHWFKNVFMLAGSAVAFLYGSMGPLAFAWWLVVGLASTCLVASANYVINEWLDAEFDRHHPLKKGRSAVVHDLSPGLVYLEYTLLLAVGLGLAYTVNLPFMAAQIGLAAAGVLYNVKPFRLKDLPFIDVIAESINNVLRLMLGWFIIIPDMIPPLTLILSFWMAGAYFMAIKRLAEYRAINDPERAGLYRRSFRFYNQNNLLLSSFFYAANFTFFFGIFLYKYRIEYILTFPFFATCLVWYLYLALAPQSVVQNPEKLYREKPLVLLLCLTVLLMIALTFIDIPWINPLLHTIPY